MTDRNIRALERAAATGDEEAQQRLEAARHRALVPLAGFEHFMDSRILLLGARWHYEGILVRCEGKQLILRECRQIFNYTKDNGVSAADDLPGETACHSDHVSATCLSFFTDRPQVRGTYPPSISSPIRGYGHLLNQRVLLLGARWHYDGDLIGCAGDQLLLRNARMIFNYTLEDGISASDMLGMSPEQKQAVAAQREAIREAVEPTVEGFNSNDGSIVSCNYHHVASASVSPFPFPGTESSDGE